MTYFTFDQNPVGGFYRSNDDVDEFVVIEAESRNEAIDKAESIGINFYDECECCGPRWSTWNIVECEIPHVPYGEAVIHYADGRKEIRGRVQ